MRTIEAQWVLDDDARMRARVRGLAIAAGLSEAQTAAAIADFFDWYKAPADCGICIPISDAIDLKLRQVIGGAQ